MKYLLSIILIFLLVPLYGRRGLEERLIEATKQTDLATLQSLMKKFERDHMSPHKKKEILSLVQATCSDVRQATKQASLVTSNQDLLSSLIGGLAGVWGISNLVSCNELMKDSSSANQSWLLTHAAGSGMITLLGGYICMQGLRKTCLQKRYEIARKIDDYLAHCKREIDFPSKNEFV